MIENSRLVYSTENGGTARPRGNAGDGGDSPAGSAKAPADGIVRVRREVKGRAGKTVTTIEGIPSRGDTVGKIASELKRRCSAGGTVKDGVIVLQGDHRKTVVPLLQEKGYRVKIAGG